jgi:hypothetical protein
MSEPKTMDRRGFISLVPAVLATAVTLQVFKPAIKGPVWCEPASGAWVCGVESLPYVYGQRVISVCNQGGDLWCIRIRRGDKWDEEEFLKVRGDMEIAKQAAQNFWSR